MHHAHKQQPNRPPPAFPSLQKSEACAVCNLDVLAEPDKWEQAVALAVREIRRLGLFGLSASELSRYVTAMLRGAWAGRRMGGWMVGSSFACMPHGLKWNGMEPCAPAKHRPDSRSAAPTE